MQLLLFAAFLLLLAVAIPYFASTGPLPISDFDVFHLAGRLVWRGDLLIAYHYDDFQDLQKLLRGRVDNLAYSYPPPYALVLAPLGLFPLAWAWLLFMAGSMALWLWALVKLAKEDGDIALMLALAPIYTTLISGQNGFLTGGLLGLACLGLRQDRHGNALAGIPFGFLVIKPQLALGLGLFFLASKRWSALAYAAATALFLCALSTLVIGMDAWPAFFASVREQAAIIWEGQYPFYRMLSPFALGMSLNLGLLAALTIYAVLFFLAAVAVGLAARRCETTTAIGIALLAGPQLSPYGFDYDLPMIVIGMALLITPSFGVIPAWQRGLALACPPVAALWSLSDQIWVNASRLHGQWPTAVGALAMLLCFWILVPRLIISRH